VSVAAPTERYLHTRSRSTGSSTSSSSSFNYLADGACAGIVTELYVPAAGYTAFPGSAALGVGALSAPYAYQNASESAIREVLSLLPPWLSGGCFASVRRLLCGTLMLPAQKKNLLDALNTGGGCVRCLVVLDLCAIVPGSESV
jgi:hypothetical protein